MNKAIVKLKPGYKGSGYITLSEGANHYTLNCGKGSIELPEDVARKLESDPRVTVEYPDGTKSSISYKSPVNKRKKRTKTEIKNMSKKEQVTLLNDLGANKIPLLEGGRVKLILKLQ